MTHYQRKPRPANFSVEAIFADVRARLRGELDIHVRVAPCFSNGIVRRILIMLDAWRQRQGVLHITGDIHFASLMRNRQRTMLTILDCGELLTRRGWRRNVLKWLWFDLPVRKAAHITTISESSKRDIIALTKCPADLISVIGVAVSDAFKPRPRKFDTQCPRILQIGTKPNKNIPNLAAALEGIPCRLIIIGKLSEPQLVSLEKNGVQFENRTNLTEHEIVNEYGKCDIVAFASTYEGFGMPIIEAQRVGRPVLTSQCSSMPEVAGTGACFVNPQDIASIRAGFKRIIADAAFRDAIVAVGFENARRFEPDVIARQYLKLYQSVFGC